MLFTQKYFAGNHSTATSTQVNNLFLKGFYNERSSPDELEKVEISDLVLVLKNTWQFLLAAFLNFFVTLSVFPSLFGLTVRSFFLLDAMYL